MNINEIASALEDLLIRVEMIERRLDALEAPKE